MRKEALAVIKILAKNQKTRLTDKWKAYMIMPQAVHEYGCPQTRFGEKRGPCKCGAAPLQKEFDAAWAGLKKKVRFMTKYFGPGGASRVEPPKQDPTLNVNWRAVWKEFKRWIDEETVGVVPWSVQKRRIQSLIRRCSSR